MNSRGWTGSPKDLKMNNWVNDEAISHDSYWELSKWKLKRRPYYGKTGFRKAADTGKKSDSSRVVFIY